MVEIALGFGLARETLSPAPLLEQLLRKGIGVGIAFRIEPGAWIAVPVPGAADAAAGLEYPRPHPQLAQFVELIQAGNAGTDDHSIKIQGRIGVPTISCRLCHTHRFFSWQRPAPSPSRTTGTSSVHAVESQGAAGQYLVLRLGYQRPEAVADHLRRSRKEAVLMR